VTVEYYCHFYRFVRLPLVVNIQRL